MNHYNINITDSLNLNLEHQIYDIDEIEQYKDYPSIVKIKSTTTKPLAMYFAM